MRQDFSWKAVLQIAIEAGFAEYAAGLDLENAGLLYVLVEMGENDPSNPPAMPRP